MENGAGHDVSTELFWRKLGGKALKLAPAPLFIFSSQPMAEAIRQLETLLEQEAPNLRFRHWLSFKTQPVPHLIRWWRDQGRPIEVVSEFELQAALQEGFAPEDILVNGPAKHHWLPAHAMPQLNVNFDSISEMEALLPTAIKLNWRVGIRCRTRVEISTDSTPVPSQFGMEPNEAATAIKRLQKSGARLEIMHFHLGTQIPKASIYGRALDEIAAICRAARFQPRFVDCGGGLPASGTSSKTGTPLAAEFSLRQWAGILSKTAEKIQGVEEIWLENGRRLSAGSGALALQILDIKERGNVRHLICNGGRTLHGMISLWETHDLFPLEKRGGPRKLTVVNGPTCMTFDRLAVCRLPVSLRAGDHLLWLNAGAYHVSWETRFSHGHAAAVWHENDRLQLARSRETFAEWWGKWRA